MTQYVSISEIQPNSSVPAVRIRQAHDRPVDPEGEYVLYWMVANRRIRWNYSVQRAVDWAKSLGKPLLILEALRCDYRWASDRLHQFIVQGMADNQRALADKPACYYPYLEHSPGAGKGLLQQLAEQACLVVSDDFPCFYLPRMVAAARRQVKKRFELVDSNGILPLRAADRVFARAYDFRRFLQKNLRPHLAEMPKSNPLSRIKLPELTQIPPEIARHWPVADVASHATSPQWFGDLPIDHHVPPAPLKGGEQPAREQLKTFLKQRLPHYADARNQPEQEVTSGLSPYLHFGHISAHEVFANTMEAEEWSPGKLSSKADGSSSGWWGTSEAAESFLDELITWRELGYNFCWQRDDYDDFSSLPKWSQETLVEHAGDPREYVYSLAEFEAAETHDPLWNAAQRQLLLEGRIHNYLRMLWGKKILEWSASPQDALEVMIELNNKYALDGRNPNSYSGIFWVLGRYDRAWGPERSIFGKVRYMSSKNTARKLKVKNYLETYKQYNSP